MKKCENGLSSVPGFLFSAIECGIRYENRLDFSLIYSEKPCNASGMFTTNKVFAAPVKLCRERVNNTIYGIIINATNANACTGEAGYTNAISIVSEAESFSKKSAGSFLMASTGIIGRQLPVEKMVSAIPGLIGQKSEINGSKVARAIMTTDTRPKEAAREFSTSQGTFYIGGTAKGSGMIAPNMATMLAFTITNAPVAKKDLDDIFRRVVDKTFNALTIDGDMSTNDTSLILSHKADQNLTGSDLVKFEEALFDLCSEISYMLVKDAEGGTKCVTITVDGAKTREDARKCARSIAQSLLVKTAFFGNDPNWGRIACAAGYSGADFSMESICVSIEGYKLLVNGEPVDADKNTLAEIMKRSEYTVSVSLGSGGEKFTFLTSDISYDYVKINAEYST